jgi:hypothetical protein
MIAGTSLFSIYSCNLAMISSSSAAVRSLESWSDFTDDSALLARFSLGTIGYYSKIFTWD